MIGSEWEDENTRIRRMKIKQTVGDQMTDDQITEVLNTAYNHVKELYYEMDNDDVEEITSKTLETDLATAINRSIIVHLGEKERQTTKAQLEVEKKIDELPEANKNNADSIITAISETSNAALVEQKKSNELLALNKSFGGMDFGGGTLGPGMNYGVQMNGPHDASFQGNINFAKQSYDQQFEAIMNKDASDYGLARGGVLDNFAGGGVLYGPSHAGGGIPTRYGELEGGEAVINKRSTAMFAGELSQINQAGGGRSFADGGKLGIGPHTADMKHAGGFIGVLPEALMRFNVPLPKFLTETALGTGYKFAEKYGAKQGLKGQGYLDGSEDYDAVQTGMDYTSMGMDAVSVGAAAIKYGKPLINRVVPGLISTAFSGAAASTLGFLGPASWALLLAQIAYTAWKNKHDEAQKELHNHGGLTENEYAVLESQLAGAVDIHNPTDIPYSGQTAMMHNLSQDQIVPSTSTYEQFDAHGRPFSQLYKGEHWIPSVPGRDAGYKSDRGDNMFFPDEYINKLKSNMGPRGNEVQAGLTRTAYLDQMLFMAKAGQAKGVTHGEVSRYATNPKDTTRYHALTATPDLPGYGYKDIYGYGPETGRTGYALKDNASIWEFWDYDNMEMQYPESKAKGGILPHPPVRKVNDAIIYANGGIIEPHPDDNIIMKKGGITHTPGGDVAPSGASRMEQILEGILHAVQAGGDTYIDGAKVSAAINSSNHNV